MIIIIPQAFKEPDPSQEMTTCNNTKATGRYRNIIQQSTDYRVNQKISSINEQLDHTRKIRISNKVQQRIPPNRPGGDS
jgi:hypothetical protein